MGSNVRRSVCECRENATACVQACQHPTQPNGEATWLPFRVIGLAITRGRGTRLGAIGICEQHHAQSGQNSPAILEGQCWTCREGTTLPGNARRPRPGGDGWASITAACSHVMVRAMTAGRGRGRPSTSINTLCFPFVGTIFSPPRSASTSQPVLHLLIHLLYFLINRP